MPGISNYKGRCIMEIKDLNVEELDEEIKTAEPELEETEYNEADIEEAVMADDEAACENDEADEEALAEEAENAEAASEETIEEAAPIKAKKEKLSLKKFIAKKIEQNKTKTKSLKTKICITCSAMFVVIVAILFTFVSISYRGIIENMFYDNSKNAMGTFERLITSYDEQLVSIVDLLIKNKDFKTSINDKSSGTYINTLDTILGCSQAEMYMVYDSENKCKATTVTKNKDLITEYMDKAFASDEFLGEINTIIGADGSITKFVCAPLLYGKNKVGAVGIGYTLTSNALLDNIKQITGAEISIFQNGVISSTTVLNGEERISGTEINTDIYSSIQNSKDVYIGTDIINSEQYMTYYNPVFDANGELSYIMFVGNSIAERTSNMTIITIIVLICVLAAAAIFIIILIFFVNKKVAKPIDQMVRVTKNISDGFIGIDDPSLVQIVVKEQDEIGQMGKSLSTTAMSLRQYITEIDRVLSNISNGNLAVQVGDQFHGDFERVKNSLTTIVNNLTEIITEFRTVASSVAQQAENISDGAQELSTGSVQQSEAIDNLYASIKVVAQDVDATAEKSDNAKTIAEKALSDVDNGNAKMNELTDAMREIAEASNQIFKINKTIEDISFQTNILALNASIEAARAGDAGKGFAVVADEVRNLAGKSSEAASRTTRLIGTMKNLIKKGSMLVEETGVTFGQITGTVSNSADLIAQISVATDQQTTSISEIKSSVERISEVVQLNSSSAEKSAEASKDLSSHAKRLDVLISKFKS